MKKRSKAPERARRLYLGPGSMMAFLGAAAILVTGMLGSGRQQSSSEAGSIVYQADSRGRMRRVEAPAAHSGAPARPLWKPEPGYLVDHSRQLALSPAESVRIRRADAEWRRAKAALLSDVAAASEDARGAVQPGKQARGATVAFVRQSLGDFSAISRQYDEARRTFWLRARAALTDAQCRKLQFLSGGAEEVTPR